jgi:hypothetical protein
MTSQLWVDLSGGSNTVTNPPVSTHQMPPSLIAVHSQRFFRSQSACFQQLSTFPFDMLGKSILLRPSREKIKAMCFRAKLFFSSSSTSLPVSQCSYNHTRLDFYNHQHLSQRVSLGRKPHTQDARFRHQLEDDGPCSHQGAPNNASPSTREAKQHPGRTTRP